MEPIYWSLILVGLGLAVIFVELFVPSAGMLGVVASICLVSGIVVAFFQDFQTGVFMMIGTLLVVPVILAIMVKVWPSTPIGRRIMIGRMSEEDVLPQGEYYTDLKGLVGQLGIAKTKMLPSGMVMINGKKYDAVSKGMPIDAGDAIKVLAVRGNRVLVAGYDGQVADLPARDSDVLSQPIEELGLDVDALEDPLNG